MTTRLGGMTEDDLLTGLGDALTLAGYRWQHSRRSDQALVMGYAGLPDIVAVHEGRGDLFAWELKNAREQPTYDQVQWIRGFTAATRIDARVIRPEDYDAAVALILNSR